MSAERVVHEVDPARVASGSWCPIRHITLGEGDISASFSADRIVMNKPVRAPFRWNGSLYVSTAILGPADRISREAFRLIPLHAFDGRAVTFAEKTRDRDAARKDPLGLFHGVSVRHGSEPFVLCGPPVHFVATRLPQADLFAGLDHGAGR